MRRALLCLPLLLGGCVYYNGVYNARRLAHAAERAEREGRTIDARNFWSQVVVKADSVVARHPASGYVPQVELLRARAFARLDQCAEAIPALEHALPSASDSAEVAAATFDLARCRASAGDIAGAAAAYRRLVGTRDPAMRQEARFQYAHALRLAGQYDTALAALTEVAGDPRAANERMVALGGTGRIPEALLLADSAIARGDTAAPWDSLLSASGRRDPAAISALVDRLVALPHATAEMRGRWLLADGRQLLLTDSAKADARLAEAAAAGGSSAPAGAARLLRAEIALARARTASDLAPVVDTLAVLRDVNGARIEAFPLYDAAVRVRAAGDSAVARGSRGDMVLFLAAEAARDGLTTPTLSRWLFRQITELWPSSPYTPKAWLALHQLDPSMSDDFQTQLEQRYPNSPYIAVMRGQNPPELRVLEDSLRAFAASQAGTPVHAAGADSTRRPAGTRPVEPQ